jgi:glyoxylase-like metal-dependent hydrolase (beta-lactamase superfamily II)
MLKVSEHGPLTRIRMGRKTLGWVVYESSAYLLGDTLVDSGCPATAGALAEWCRGRGVRRVVHTHHHEDHVGGDARLIRECGVSVHAPPRTVSILAKFYRIPTYRRMVWGQPESVSATPFTERVDIGGRPFEVVPTPGHAADHVCLFEPREGWLFTGDLYISPRVRYLRPSEDPCVILESLRRLLTLEPQLLICSHAGVVEPARPALEERIAAWETLAEKVRGLAAEGHSDRVVTRRLLGREGLLSWLSLGDFAKLNLVRGLIGSCSTGEDGK